MSENLINTIEIGHLLELEIVEENGVSKTLKTEILELSSDNKCVISVPFLKGRFYPLQIGLRYKFYYNKRDAGVYQFQGLVISRQQNGNQQTLTILRVSEFNKSQRRLYFRLPILIDAVLLVEDGTIMEKVLVEGKVEEREFANLREDRCVIKDISGGGMKLQAHRSYAIDSKVIIEFQLSKDIFKLKSTVRRCFRIDDVIERYDIGLLFDVLEESDRSKIIAFIFDKQRNLLKKGLV